MRKLTDNYLDNVELFDTELNVKDNFDILKKKLKIGEDDITLYYIDGFVKDAVMQKLMMYFLSLDSLGNGSANAARRFVDEKLPYVEVEAIEADAGESTVVESAEGAEE